jgi:hypothetical protein
LYHLQLTPGEDGLFIVTEIHDGDDDPHSFTAVAQTLPLIDPKTISTLFMFGIPDIIASEGIDQR